MVQLRQQEAQEEAAFRELIAKMTPPTVTLDASGRELTIAQADSPNIMVHSPCNQVPRLAIVLQKEYDAVLSSITLL